ncbi:MAG: hypothetical protein DWH97_01495 [Planctomycetota bacterium]|nr:MAG: hypothetical protein DWH97_01495 [Planctomycetota bacterium]RLS96763.1 MAG: hypothetical protein DWI12_01665 [Planctomycetota bacterium]
MCAELSKPKRTSSALPALTRIGCVKIQGSANAMRQSRIVSSVVLHSDASVDVTATLRRNAPPLTMMATTSMSRVTMSPTMRVEISSGSRTSRCAKYRRAEIVRVS